MRVDITMFEACHAAGEDHRGLSMAYQIGILDGAGTSEHQVMAIEMHPGVGEDIVPFQIRLGAIAADQQVTDAVRGRAARLLAMIAEDLADADAGKRAMDLIRDLPDSSPDAVIARLINETVFGSTDVAIELADRLYSMAHAAGNHSPRIPPVGTAGGALLRCGEIDRAVQYYLEAYNLSAAKSIWSACTAYAAAIANACWMKGDLAGVETWYARSTESLRKSSHPDRGYQQVAAGILLALSKGDSASAREILESGIKTYPNLATHRFGFEVASFRIRIDIAAGRPPSQNQLDELLAGHRQRRHLGLHDPVADTLIGALRATGQSEQAEILRTEYLSIYRRDRFPVAKVYTNLG